MLRVSGSGIALVVSLSNHESAWFGLSASCNQLHRYLSEHESGAAFATAPDSLRCGWSKRTRRQPMVGSYPWECPHRKGYNH